MIEREMLAAAPAASVGDEGAGEWRRREWGSR
jgi:hypothetical protein